MTNDDATIRLDYTPRPWQRECRRQRRRFSVLALHRRAGKTIYGVMELIDAAMRSEHSASLFAYLAPFLKMARQIAWAELKRKVAPLIEAGAVEVREGDMLVRFPNGAVIQLFGADNPDALRGLRLDGIVLDEVAQMAPVVWTDIVQPALADRLGWATFIGTPAGIDLFSELFYGASSKPDWFAARFTVDETNALDAAEIARLRAESPPQTFAREFLCDFAAAGDDQLIAMADVDAAARRTYTERDVMHAPRIVGVDPARFGDDRSVIAQRQGLVMLPPLVFRGVDNMALASHVAGVAREWQPDAIFVDSGAGAGVIDRLRQLGFDVLEVPFGGKALKPTFLNRRTEMWCTMADWIRAGGSIPHDIALMQELATPIYWFDAQGRRVLESKDDIRARLLGSTSPDIADALALTFAAPVQTARDAEYQRSVRRQREPVDPFARLRRR